MRGRGRITGIAIASAVAFGAALGYPDTLGLGLRSPQALACLTCTCDPAVEELVEGVDDQLAARMAGIDDATRRQLAWTVVSEANAAGIDPLLVLAVIEVESAYDPEASSYRGAKGLMQLLEPTMRQELTRGGIAFDDPHDPIANVQAGVRYLRRLLEAFGREEVALMAYNAGPNRILGYLREGGIPERFRTYPRRVSAELRRLRRAVGASEATLVAESRILSVAQ